MKVCVLVLLLAVAAHGWRVAIYRPPTLNGTTCSGTLVSSASGSGSACQSGTGWSGSFECFDNLDSTNFTAAPVSRNGFYTLKVYSPSGSCSTTGGQVRTSSATYGFGFVAAVGDFGPGQPSEALCYTVLTGAASLVPALALLAAAVALVL